MLSQTASLQVTKTPNNKLSKVGDTVTYKIEICNTGEVDLQRVSVLDTYAGVTEDLTSQFPATLGVGQCASVTTSHVVTASDSSPLVNTVKATYTASLSASDTASVELFQPSVTIAKSGPQYSKVGDTVTYTYTITNTSSQNSPPLILNLTETDGHFAGGVVDDVVGDLTEKAVLASASPLYPGTSVKFMADYTVKATDPDPLENHVSVYYHPQGFPNLITATSSWSVDLVHPSYTVSNTCTSGSVSPGGTATFRVDVKNTGDVPLDITALDQGVTRTSQGLSAGSTFTFSVSVPVPAVTPPDCTRTVSNTVDVTITLPSTYGLKNTYHEVVTANCPVAVLGKTRGFWGNKNGNAILNPDASTMDDDIDPAPVTIGVQGATTRGVTVVTVTDSNKTISGNYCSLSGSNCGSRSDNLQQGTLSTLMAQTLALSYNIIYIPCYSGQTIADLGCTPYLPIPGTTLSATSTVNDVLAVANSLIANSLANSPSPQTTQAQAGAMNALLGCLNAE